MPPPVVISSAAPGKKAAPKAPVRRRPAPAAPPPPAQKTPAPETTASSIPPPSPTPTQQSIAPERPAEQEPTPAPTEHADPVEPAIEKLPAKTVVESTLETAPTPPPKQAIATQIAVPPTPEPTQSPQPDIPQTREKSPAPVQSQPESSAPKPTQEQPTPQPENVEPVRQTEGNTQPALSVTNAAPKVNNKRARKDAPAASAPRPAKRAKQSSSRSNAKVQAAIEEDVQPQPTTSSTPANAETPEATSQSEAAPPRKKATRKAAPKPRKPTGKVKSAARIVDSGDEGEALQTEDTADTEPEAPAPKAKAPRKRRPRKGPPPSRAKSATAGSNQEQPDQPETDQPQDEESDPETHEIDESKVSMFDLSFDQYHGKTSERGRQMAEIDWEEVAHKRRAAANLIVTGGQGEGNDVVQSVEGTDNAASSRSAANAQSPPPARNQETIGFRLDHNGEIVADEVTLELARGEQERDQAENAPVEEINDLTVQINRTTWANNNRRDAVDRVPAWKWRSDPWSEEETDKFYDAIRMFGTDFFIISKMFPPKTRRMIKAKFVREEKLDPERINNALCGKEVLPMSLDHYSRETGKDVSVFTKYEGFQHAQSVINASMKDKQDELAISLEQEATLAAERDEEKKQKEKQKKEGRKPRKKPNKGGGTMGGGPEEVTESTEVEEPTEVTETMEAEDAADVDEDVEESTEVLESTEFTME